MSPATRRTQNNSIMFLTPTPEQEILEIIQLPGSNASSGYDQCFNKILKVLSQEAIQTGQHSHQPEF